MSTQNFRFSIIINSAFVAIDVNDPKNESKALSQNLSAQKRSVFEVGHIGRYSHIINIGTHTGNSCNKFSCCDDLFRRKQKNLKLVIFKQIIL